MTLNRTYAPDYTIKLINATNIIHLVPNSDITEFIDTEIRMTDLLPVHWRLPGFAIHDCDIATSISYYLSQSPKDGFSEVWLQKFNDHDSYMGHQILPVNVSIGSHLQMNIEVSDAIVYTAVVTDASSVYCDQGCNSTAKSDIYIFQYDKNDLLLKSKLILSTPDDDIIPQMHLDSTTGALNVMWITKNPSGSVLYSFSFAPFRITDILPVAEPTGSLIRENYTLLIEFSVPIAELQLGMLLVPNVIIGKRKSRSVKWTNETIIVSVPQGVGIEIPVGLTFHIFRMHPV